MIETFYVAWHGDGKVVEREARQMLDRLVRSAQIKITNRKDVLRVQGDVHTIDALVEHGSDCQCFGCTGIQPPPLPPKPYDPLDYFRVIIEQGGGIITLPDHLGVLVGGDPQGTPAGWLFVDVEGLTPEVLKDRVDSVRAGRAAWPENARLGLVNSRH